MQPFARCVGIGHVARGRDEGDPDRREGEEYDQCETTCNGMAYALMRNAESIVTCRGRIALTRLPWYARAFFVHHAPLSPAAALIRR